MNRAWSSVLAVVTAAAAVAGCSSPPTAPTPTHRWSSRWVRIETPPDNATVLFTCRRGDGLYAIEYSSIPWGTVQVVRADPACHK